MRPLPWRSGGPNAEKVQPGSNFAETQHRHLAKQDVIPGKLLCYMNAVFVLFREKLSRPKIKQLPL